MYSSRLILLLMVTTVGALAPVHAQDGGTRSTLDGVYTEEQARRGANINSTVCVECHEDEEFTGPFLDSWTGAPVSMLFEEIKSLMPEDRPGTLKPQEYADVLAYIFSLNGIPAGAQELPTSLDTLVTIFIERPAQ